MPRPSRRAPAAQAREDLATTPTRQTTTNAITAAIPPFMLETPPHAPFLTTPNPPSNHPGQSIVPEANARANRNARAQQQTPTANGNIPGGGLDQSHISANALGSAVSENVGQGDEQSLLESVHYHAEDVKQLAGLRDISSLATWTLSSAKPGCALAQLRNPNPGQFWQSDGPQPHTLTLHFFKLVAIVKLRIYLDFELDESYTPTKIRFFAGMSEGGLVEFGAWDVPESTDPDTGETQSNIESVKGWIDISLRGVGGRETRQHEDKAEAQGQKHDWFERLESGDDEDDGDSGDLFGGDVLKAMIVQVRVCENHQNGKDTHVRGFQVFAKDEVGTKEARRRVRRNKQEDDPTTDDKESSDVVGLRPAEWMLEPDLR